MAISTAERNRRKRERKKREKELKRREEEENAKASTTNNTTKSEEEEEEEEVLVEYVPEVLKLAEDGMGNVSVCGSTGEEKKELNDEDSMAAVLRRFEERSSVVAVISDDESKQRVEDETTKANESDDESDDDDNDDQNPSLSKRKLRELTRPSIAKLKNEVSRSDLVEAHDVTAADPHFLIYLKSTPGTVAVPRHWGRKRKYLQGKRGIEKAPFALPDFIVRTGITEMRSALQKDEANMSLKQKNRSRVAPKSMAVDVDYRTLHDAFFKYQTKPHLTTMGDLYYEGKEFETGKSNNAATRRRPGEISERLRVALSMAKDNDTAPPPWLWNMQRHGPPPSYPNLKIPGLNAPLPSGACSYGYHTNGWGKPPLDAFGRPLYGGDPFGPPPALATASNELTSTENNSMTAIQGINSATTHHNTNSLLVTSDGKTLLKDMTWGALPTVGAMEDDDDDNESSSSEEEDDAESEDMEDNDNDNENKVDTTDETTTTSPTAATTTDTSGVESVLPTTTITAQGLRKTGPLNGDETPLPTSSNNNNKPLYQVLEQTEANRDDQQGAIFQSDVAYVLPGAESVLTKAGGTKSTTAATTAANNNKRRRRGFDNVGDEDEDDAALGKKFKF